MVKANGDIRCLGKDLDTTGVVRRTRAIANDGHCEVARGLLLQRQCALCEPAAITPSPSRRWRKGDKPAPRAASLAHAGALRQRGDAMLLQRPRARPSSLAVAFFRREHSLRAVARVLPGVPRYAVRTARPRLLRVPRAYPVRTVRGASGQAALRLWYVTAHARGWYA